MILQLTDRVVRAIKYKATPVSHQAIIATIIQDSGMCKHALLRCINVIIYNTPYTQTNSLHLPKQFSHDVSLLDSQYRAALCFIFDELYSNIYRYRDSTSAFEVYCLIGKILNAK